MDTNPQSTLFEFGSASDRGRKRISEPNQDTAEVVLADPNGPWHPPLLLVADGMGGYYGGSLASQLVVSTFKKEFKGAHHPAEDYPALMIKCAEAAHQEVRAHGAKAPRFASMGSTLVAVVLETQRLFLLNIGDSRAYLLHDNRITQISRDQSWVAEKVRAGILTEQEARTNPDRNRLTMAITAKRTEVKPLTAGQPLESQDIILLCSDGLWGVVPETLILAAATELSPQVAAEKLVALANQSKGPDNISVVIARRAGFANRTSMLTRADTIA